MPQSYVTIRGGPPALALPLGLAVSAVAFECRTATINFLRGSGWGRPEIVAWIVGRYRPVTLRPERGADNDRPAPSSRADWSGLPAVIAEARRETLRALRTALTPAAELDFAVAGIEGGHVVRVVDTFGAEGWAPVDRPRIRLADRVVSLVAAHRLTCPDAFEAAWEGFDGLLEEVEVDELWTATA